MKGKGHIQSFNEHQENLNISDVRSSFSKKSSIKKFLEDEENRFVWDVSIDFAKWINDEGIERSGENWRFDVSNLKSGIHHNTLVDDNEIFKLFLENYF
jgi:hypothetical protein